MLTVQEDGKLGVPNGRSMNVERYANYLAERAKGLQCRSNFFGNTKWWNDHIAVPLTPKEKERAEKEKGTRSSRSAGANVLAFATFSCRGEKTPASRLRLLEAVNLQQYDGPR